MKSFRQLGGHPASLPLMADEIVEFHLARLLLLIRICGISNRIDGLTKLAKLDFFARYPDFFAEARGALKLSAPFDELPDRQDPSPVESAMVRHHYGPWDKRYYHVLAHLEAKQLISIQKAKSAYKIQLTALGIERADGLAKCESFIGLVDRMRSIKSVFGGKSGSFLKKHIYAVFDQEVGRKSLGEEIRT